MFPVGRLDYDSSGLLILTNDGEAANILAHPSFGVEKTYVVSVDGAVSNKTISALTAGVELEDGVIAADSVRRVLTSRASNKTLLEITLHSGKNRVVRRMCSVCWTRGSSPCSAAASDPSISERTKTRLLA